ILRIKALLRRAKIVSERKIIIGKVSLNYDSLTVSRESERYTLPQKEFLLLYKLLSYPDTIFTRMQLMDEIWGYDSQTGDHTVSVHIGRLRERFSGWPEFDIVTVRGLGYKAVKNDDR
ncbi:MAG: response regulator transcription factor, partial [Firmicutes bacterium]|nr:response regulator transcription factor [Bacillota bacterium]